MSAGLKYSPMISEADLQARVAQIGAELAELGTADDVAFLAIEYGALPFAKDLLAHIPGADLHSIRVSTYLGTTEAQREPVIEGGMPDGFAGKTVVVIEDILDTGNTLAFVHESLVAAGATAVEVCVLLSKRKARDREVSARWVGFGIDDEFVIGYGLDYQEEYRDLPYVALVDLDSLPG